MNVIVESVIEKELRVYYWYSFIHSVVVAVINVHQVLQHAAFPHGCLDLAKLFNVLPKATVSDQFVLCE